MITLTLEASERELISGIPEYVTFSASSPATIYYTLDGTQPTSSSIIATGKIYLPTSGSTVEVRAVAISSSESSDEIQKTYKTNSTKLNGSRNIGAEGIAVMRDGDISVNNMSIGPGGAARQESSTEFNDLDIKASRVSSTGVLLDSNKTSVSFVNFPTIPMADEDTTVSTVNDNYNFNPKAKVIVIDGTTTENMEEQVVKIVNRPYNNIDTTSPFYNEHLGSSEQIVTGNFVKAYYNPVNGIYTSFYWESRESRWLKSIQKIDKPPLRIRHSSVLSCCMPGTPYNRT